MAVARERQAFKLNMRPRTDIEEIKPPLPSTVVRRYFGYCHRNAAS